MKISSFLTGSYSSHERKVKEPSSSPAKKYAMKNTGGIYVLT
jgi:hypothetical protein